MSARTAIIPKTLRQLSNKLTTIRSDERGVAAIEFSFFAALLCFGLLNTADIGIYIYKQYCQQPASHHAVHQSNQLYYQRNTSHLVGKSSDIGQWLSGRGILLRE